MAALNKKHDYLYWIVWTVIFLVLLLFFLSPLSAVLYIVLTAFIISYLLSPIVAWLEAPYIRAMTFPICVPRVLSSLILPFGMVFLGFYVVSMVLISVIRDLPKTKIYIETAVKYYNQSIYPMIAEKVGTDMSTFKLDVHTDALILLISNQAKSSLNLLPNIAGLASGTISNVLNALLWCILVPLMVFYILSNWQHICELHRLFWARYLPLRHQDFVQKIVTDIDIILRSLIEGQITVCLVMGMIYAILLTSFHIPFGVLIGVLAGIACCIPIVGVIVPLIVSLLVAAFEPSLNTDFMIYLKLLVTFVVGGFLLEGKFLSPKLIGDKIEVPGPIVILGILAGEKMAGVFGMLVALPVISILKVLLVAFSNWWLTTGRPEIHLGLLQKVEVQQIEAEVEVDSSPIDLIIPSVSVPSETDTKSNDD
jgi:predicted PurR-regulated permease PerM